MSAIQVVLDFERQEDAIRFTVAASSVFAADEPASPEALLALSRALGAAQRIRTEALSPQSLDDLKDRCA